MNYDELKAAELKALCIKRGIQPSRAKIDMIEDLKARDAADELTKLGQEMAQEATDAPLPASEGAPSPVTLEKAPEPVKADETPWWVFDGRLYKRYVQDGALTDLVHEGYIADVVEEALTQNFVPYGPSFRVSNPDLFYWVYAVNVR